MTKRILDVCCGSKMFWFQKHHPDVVYMDIRHENGEIHGKHIHVDPDVIGDFRNIHMMMDDSIWSYSILHICAGPDRTLL